MGNWGKRVYRARALVALALLGTALVACSKPAQDANAHTPVKHTSAPCRGAATPELAIQNMMQALQSNDLERIPCLATTPIMATRLELAWREGRSRWPLTELPLSNKLVPVLGALTAPNADKTLKARFDKSLAGQTNALHQTARGLGLFAVRYLQREGDYTTEERAHYAALIVALGTWAEKAPLGDKQIGHDSIDLLVAAARESGLRDENGIREAGMRGSLRALSPLFAASKDALRKYGLSLDDILGSVTVSRSDDESDADHARVHVTYRVAGNSVSTDVDVERRDGLWYTSGLLTSAEKAINAPQVKIDKPVLVDQNGQPVQAPTAKP
ncbi:hypothetical protein [Lysobacter soyae]|uniref:Lipoprotein n=1 Tax=Lysobacter soyae TaxID=2764185 RepID=A0ABX8WQV3_9GAMM|nr:hypothetical protein [Lysobacter sp. CJ11]QYR53211.1 hypothetical protein H8L67_01430 [Lysobacter sp. CJ11]